MCIKNIVTFLFVISSVCFSIAQTIESPAVAEQKTIQLYLAKDWKELALYGEKAIAQGYDYYYMRMRTAIAFYEQKKYEKAIPHFQKALQYSADTLTLEYLYYSYVFAGRSSEARALTDQFPNSMKQRIQPQGNKLIESVYIESGVGLSNLPKLYNNIDIDKPFNLYGEATIIKNMQYLHAGLKHQLNSKWELYHGYNYIGINFNKDIKIADKDTTDSYRLLEQDYYINLKGQLKHFSVSPAFHFINVRLSSLQAVFDNKVNRYVFAKGDTSFINYALSCSLEKTVGIITYNLCPGFARLNGNTQLQTAGSVTYYPFGKPDFYGTSMLVWLSENSKSRVIVGQKVGIKLLPKLWSEASITYGNLQNYCESNAFVIFNTGDKITCKYGVVLLSPVSKHVQLSLRYDRFNRENIYYEKNNLDILEPVTVRYITQTIVAGVKWTF